MINEKAKNKEVIELLCEEIGATYTKNMETIPVLVSFVCVLVDEIDDLIQVAKKIAHLTGKEIPSGTEEAVDRVRAVLALRDRDKLIEDAALAHETVHAPDGVIPCNHYMDMLSSCVSAIRFGFEQPCQSRHAAAAADHVWQHVYGVSRFDKHSHKWGKQWARVKFYEALGAIAGNT